MPARATRGRCGRVAVVVAASSARCCSSSSPRGVVVAAYSTLAGDDDSRSDRDERQRRIARDHDRRTAVRRPPTRPRPASTCARARRPTSRRSASSRRAATSPSSAWSRARLVNAPSGPNSQWLKVAGPVAGRLRVVGLRRRRRRPARAEDPGLPGGLTTRSTGQLRSLAPRAATTAPACHPGARPPAGGVHRREVDAAARQRPRDDRVRVPHLARAQLVASPHRGRDRRARRRARAAATAPSSLRRTGLPIAARRSGISPPSQQRTS